MTRLFTPVEEAVEIIQTAIDNIDFTHGKILCREMKAGLIGDFLKVWTERQGGSWEQIPARPGERTYEHLIGEAECEYTTSIKFNGNGYFLIQPNRLADEPIPEIISSFNAERFTDDEMWKIIENNPDAAA
jgi:UDP-N-acetylglucosamine 4,6-dehydratase/UDP-glucose 4-epimerase